MVAGRYRGKVLLASGCLQFQGGGVAGGGELCRLLEKGAIYGLGGGNIRFFSRGSAEAQQDPREMVVPGGGSGLPRRAALRRRWSCLTKPLAWGWYAVVGWWVMLRCWQRWDQRAEVNWGPRSVVMWVGDTKAGDSLMNEGLGAVGGGGRCHRNGWTRSRGGWAAGGGQVQ